MPHVACTATVWAKVVVYIYMSFVVSSNREGHIAYVAFNGG